jgi:hypothetical protein
MPLIPSTPDPGGGINRATLISLGGVLASGAVGGLLFWIVARWSGSALPSVFGQGTVFVLMFVGALAGAFGVFLLTASDLNAIRTYVFAVICGMAWQPVLGSAQRLATNAVATNQTAQIGDRVDQIKSATNSGSSQQISNAVENTVPAVNQALSLSANVSDASKKAEIIDKSKQAINELQTTSVKAPDASVEALKSISLTATNAGESGVAIHAIETLHTIGNNAERSNNPAVALKVRQSLSALAIQSRDPSVQSAARSAAVQMSH